MIHMDKNKNIQDVRRLRQYLMVLIHVAFDRRKYQINMGQLIKNFLAFCATRKFVTVLTFRCLTTYIYICRTAALTSRRYILNIYSTNIHTEYFKNAE